MRITKVRTKRNHDREDELVDNIQIPLVLIQPSKGWVPLRVKELWDYRELLYFFIWRDIKVRYKQTLMGVSWAIIQPIMTMVIFSIFFGKLAGVPSDNIPYPIFSYTALVPWTFFSNGLTQGSNSLVNNADMLRKIYFPRLTLPAATVLSGLLDFFLALFVLFGMMMYYSIIPTVNIIWLPFFLVLTVITSLGVSLWLSVLNVQFRDVRYTLPFITQAWLFATPIAYPSSLLSEPWRTIYAINPMVGVVEGFRWALLGTEPAPGPMVLVSTLVAILVLIGGIYYIRRMERTFADVV